MRLLAVLVALAVLLSVSLSEAKTTKAPSCPEQKLVLRPEFISVKSISDCGPKDSTNEQECQVKSAICDALYSLTLQYFSEPCPGANKRTGCQCPNRCSLPLDEAYCPAPTSKPVTHNPTTTFSPTVPTTYAPFNCPTCCECERRSLTDPFYPELFSSRRTSEESDSSETNKVPS